MRSPDSTVYTLPDPPTSVDSSLHFLKQLNINAIHLGLERIKTVLPLLGDPQNQRPCIHVAGTNGKGSTCAMLESIYRHNGYKTGLTVSPHLISPLERIQVNHQPLSDEAWMDSFMRVYNAVKSLPDGYLSYFEWLTVMAFDAFNKAQVDIAIIETGLGGRLDASNVIDKPVATVLTSISLDHIERLGNSLVAIAAEKADIIRPNTPVITSGQYADVLQVLAEVITQRNAQPVHAVTEWTPSYEPLKPSSAKDTLTRQYHRGSDPLELSLLGHYQEVNLALALGTVKTLEPQFPTQWDKTKDALAHTQWPGRYQWVKTNDEGWLIVDGSHNEAGLVTLAQSINHDCDDLLAPRAPLRVGLSLMQHRNPESLVSCLSHLHVPYQAYCLELDSADLPAMHNPTELAATLSHALSLPVETMSLEAFLQPAEREVHETTEGLPYLSLITGSLYTAGHVLSQLSHKGVHHLLTALAPSS